MKRTALIAACFMLAACSPDDGSRTSDISDGVTRLNSTMLGFWYAPGSPHCMWKKYAKNGVKVAEGNGPQSQTLGVYSADDQGKLVSDQCGPWSRRIK